MAVKKPLANYSGQLSELPAGDTLSPVTLATGTRNGTESAGNDRGTGRGKNAARFAGLEWHGGGYAAPGSGHFAL